MADLIQITNEPHQITVSKVRHTSLILFPIERVAESTVELW